jgi:hypothetical protein
MEGLLLLILICLVLMFGPPVVFIVLGIVKRHKSPAASKTFFILGVLWLIVGSGICATIMSS